MSKVITTRPSTLICEDFLRNEEDVSGDLIIFPPDKLEEEIDSRNRWASRVMAMIHPFLLFTIFWQCLEPEHHSLSQVEQDSHHGFCWTRRWNDTTTPSHTVALLIPAACHVPQAGHETQIKMEMSAGSFTVWGLDSMSSWLDLTGSSACSSEEPSQFK